MAVEILRRRWFGTEVSSLLCRPTPRRGKYAPAASPADLLSTGSAFGTCASGESGSAPGFSADEIDVTSEVDETGVMMLNRERIATL
jgi:hypothetical protein